MKSALSWIGIFTAIIVSNCGIGAAEAPWGFAWSQEQDSLPPPSSLVVDANQISLAYEGSALPVQMKDTEVVILRICEGHGLQQVRWISRLFSQSAGINKFLDSYEEGANRYGEADQGDVDRGAVGWSKERIGIRLQRDEPGKDAFRVIMVSDGPGFDECQAEHKRITGH